MLAYLYRKNTSNKPVAIEGLFAPSARAVVNQVFIAAEGRVSAMGTGASYERLVLGMRMKDKGGNLHVMTASLESFDLVRAWRSLQFVQTADFIAERKTLTFAWEAMERGLSSEHEALLGSSWNYKMLEKCYSACAKAAGAMPSNITLLTMLKAVEKHNVFLKDTKSLEAFLKDPSYREAKDFYEARIKTMAAPERPKGTLSSEQKKIYAKVAALKKG